MTDIGSLGEFGLIDKLTAGIQLKNPGSHTGVGDDAAVINAHGQFILVSKDLLVEGVHFDLTYHPLRHLGYKAAVVNISDIVAMNGHAKQLLVGMALSSRFTLEAVEELYTGIKLACEKYQVDLIGGDTTSSQAGLFLSITVLGEASPEQVILRSTAQAGDLLCVSGDLGAAYMGLLVLEREKEVFKADASMQPDLDSYEYILERQLKPEARPQVLETLSKAGIKPTAMIDISDGLASETMHICRGSSLGCRIYEERIPIDPATILAAEEFKIDPVMAALNGGEDYELLFTVSLLDHEKVARIPGISVIGHMTDAEQGMCLVEKTGNEVPLNAQGWDALLRANRFHRQTN